MGAVTATILSVEPHDTNVFANNGGTAAVEGLKTFRILFNNGSTQVAGGSDTLDVNVATVIPAWTRKPMSYALRGHMLCQPARIAAGTTTYTGTTATSTNTVQLTPKTTDFASNATVSASALVGGQPFGILVAVSET